MITVVVELRGDDRLDDIEDGEKSGGSFFAAKTAFSPRRELLHPQLSPTFNFNPFNPPSPPPFRPLALACIIVRSSLQYTENAVSSLETRLSGHYRQ
jgi:hypothetical protein